MTAIEITEDQGDETASEAEVSAVVTMHPNAERSQHLRILEAILFAATEPVSIDKFKEHLPETADVAALLEDLRENYSHRGVNLVQLAGKYMFRTAEDMAFVLRKDVQEQKRLTKAGLETLAIIAYHQPVTRAEIEDIRGVAISKGTLDTLLDIGWIKMRGRRKTPGRPVTYGTTDTFMQHFGLNDITDLPGLQELKAAGLLEANLPPGFDVPVPKAPDDLTADEEPLDGTEQLPLEMHLPDPDQPDAPQGEAASPAQSQDVEAAEKSGGEDT
ncbi:MAG: SMC-Scp complex subunit ScpB [Rhizobiales bacterium]|nr:SMC-Scp complex subunit ScpB [Hyphomicrobiales bacterium]